MKKYSLIILAILAIPCSGFAENSVAQASGISDGVLLLLMLFFILLLLAVIKALSKSIEGISRSTSLEKKEDNAGVVKTIALLLFMGTASATQAAESLVPSSPVFVMNDGLFYLLLSLIVFLAVVIAVLFRSLTTLIKLEKGESFEEEEKEEDLFKSLNLTDNVPIEREVDIMLDHDYDGIKELDNNLPPWWKYMFYATIVFAFVYIIRYHISGDGKLQGAEYAAEMQEAAEQKADLMANATESITEENVEYLIDAPSLTKGAAIYKGNCATCHGQLGEGGAGPNLTDEYWLHGGGISNVFKTIKYGVPAKGMIAWQSQFSPSQMQKVASYVLNLQGSNPPNGKAPQGEIFKEEIVEVADSTQMNAIDSTQQLIDEVKE